VAKKNPPRTDSHDDTTTGPANVPGDAPEPSTEPDADAEETRRHAVAQRAARQAEGIRTAVLPSCLASTLALSHFDGQGYRTYLEDFVRDAGNPTDPIERVLLEQLGFAHLRVAQLHANAAQAGQVEAARVYTSAAARLLAELRRLALAVKGYRQSASDGESAGQQRRLKVV
jgi:hypothetical protein